MVDSINHNEWLSMAMKDIRSAKILFAHDADYEMVCFHCQQAVEKYLKGYLIEKTGQLQEGHSLLKLSRKAGLHNPLFKKYDKDMTFLNVYYIETRYSAVDPLVVIKEDTEECLAIVERIVSLVNEEHNL